MYVCMYTNIHMYLRTYVCMYVRMYVCMHDCMCVCVCVCMYHSAKYTSRGNAIAVTRYTFCKWIRYECLPNKTVVETVRQLLI